MIIIDNIVICSPSFPNDASFPTADNSSLECDRRKIGDDIIRPPNRTGRWKRPGALEVLLTLVSYPDILWSPSISWGVPHVTWSTMIHQTLDVLPRHITFDILLIAMCKTLSRFCRRSYPASGQWTTETIHLVAMGKVTR